jgi:uncharacterized protein
MNNYRPIIDMHCHTAGIGEGDSGCFISDKLRNSWKFSHFLASFGSTLKEVEKEGDAVLIKHIAEQVRKSKHIDGAVILAQDGIVDDAGELDMERTEMFVPDDFILNELTSYPQLLPGISINPYRVDAIERLHDGAKKGAVLVKWIASIMHIDPSDKRIKPFYQEMINLNLPLLAHTGDERTFTFAIDELCDPLKLELPLKMGVTVIAAHMASSGKTAGESNMKRLARLFTKYPNLYGDISSLTQVNRLGQMKKTLQTEAFIGRMLYGTDYPLVNTALCSPLVHINTIGIRKVAKLWKVNNPFDRDVELKRAMGLPEDVFMLPAELLKSTMIPAKY